MRRDRAGGRIVATGVGKTVVACATAQAWRREGRDFRVCKPVVSLAERSNVEELRKRIGVPLLGVLPYSHERGVA